MAAYDYTNSGFATGDRLLGTTLNGQTAGDYSSSLTIEELSAPSGQQPRVVVLQGPSLPFRGANWDGENAVKTTWYPGNGDEATQQVLGPREGPSNWQGEWNRTRMGKAPANATDETGQDVVIVDPEILADFLESMLRGGSRLRVTWSVASEDASSRGKKVREGVAKTWSFKYDRIQDIAWSIDFEWAGRGVKVQAVSNTALGALAAMAAQLNLALSQMAAVQAATSLIASNTSIPLSANTLTLGQLENFAAAPTTLVEDVGRSFEQVQTQLQQVADIAATFASQPTSVVEAAVSVARNAIAGANQMVDELGQNPFEGLSGSDDVNDMMRSWRYFAQSGDAANAASAAAQQAVDQLQKRAPTPPLGGAIDPATANAQAGDILATYVCKDGDTPKRVSMRFYKTPDHDVDIQQTNRRPWGEPTYPRGQILVIPRLRQKQKTT